MEVISSKSFEEESSEEENSQNNNLNYNSEPYYKSYSQNKLDYNNISEEEELENNDNENNSNEMEINRINEINELDEDEEETEGNIENNMGEHYEENEISNSVENAENNTINTIDEENDEYNENSLSNSNNNNMLDNICNYNLPIENKTNKQNIQILIDNGVNRQIPFIYFEDDKFVISEDAKNLFNQIGNNKIGIISFLGEYHSKNDKFLLLKKIISKNAEIELFDYFKNDNNKNSNKNNKNSNKNKNNNIKNKNNGILLYSKPLIIKNNFCDEEFPCFIIDSFNSDLNINDDEEINHDSKIFMILILISSLLVFNSIDNIGQQSLINFNFILKLIKNIKIKNTLEEENDSEMAQFVPTLLWVLQNSNLKLEDRNGNTITEKQYMEASLQTINGSSDSIEENNRIKTLIKILFKERDCFVINDTSNISFEEKNNNSNNNINKKQNKNNDEMINIFKNKIIKKTKPKMFYHYYLNGNMIIELIESILNNINSGGVPILSNSWKYIMKSECAKLTQNLIYKFGNELKAYRNENINKKIFFDDTQIERFKIKIIQKYIKEFMNNNIIDDETKKEFSERIKNKLELEIKNYEKENEKYFEEKFIKDLNLLSNKFMENFTSSDIYEKNSYKFFQDFENFRENAVLAAPDFPKKNEILFNKVLLIIKKFINGKIMKIKVINEEKSYLENENKKQEEKLNELNNELNIIKEKNNEFIQKLNNDIQIEKKKYKRVEDKINGMIYNKSKEIENLKKEIEIETNNYENKIREIIETNNNLNKEIKVKDEQLLVMKMNNEKISSLYEQKSKFLEREITNWKDKYTITIKEGMIKENELNKENLKLKEQNKILMRKEKSKREESNRKNSATSKHSSNKNINENINNINGIETNLNNLNNGNDNISVNTNNTNNSGNNKISKNNNISGLMSYIKMNFKDKKNKMLKLDKFFLNRKKQSQEKIKEKREEKKEENKIHNNSHSSNNNNNYFENENIDSNKRENSIKSNKRKKNSFTNHDSNNSSKEKKKKSIEEQIIDFNQYKDLINNAKDFKCKFCLKNFSFPDFKEHYNVCTKNPINMNTMNNSNTQADFDGKEKSNNKAKINSNTNTIFTSEKINNSHLENDFNIDNLSINKSTIKKFTLSNSSINSNNNLSANNNNLNIPVGTNMKNINTKSNNTNNNTNINNNGTNKLENNKNNISNNNTNNNKIYISTNKVLNYKNKKDNSYNNNNLTNINSSNTVNNSDNTNNKCTNIIENNINLKKGNYKNINLYYYDSNKNSNNNKKNINNSNIFVPKKLKIKIIKGRIRKDKSGKPYLEYIINIDYDNVINWNINRRFNQFTNLYKTLRTISKESFEMPESSNIFNNITALFSGLSHENKILQLEKFLKDLTETEGISNSKHLYCFLELNNLLDENNNIIVNTINNNINNNGIIYNHKRRNNDVNIPKNKNNNIVFANNKHYYNSTGLSDNNSSGINSGVHSNINSNINSNRIKILNGVLE